MNTTWNLGTRSLPTTAFIAKLLAGLIGVAALGSIYPVAAALASAMTATLRMAEAREPAPMLVSPRAAERDSLGL